MSVEVVAPVAGKVLELQVKAGDPVKCDDELLLIEALKMENPIYAPSDGRILEVRVTVGVLVEAQQVLLVIG